MMNPVRMPVATPPVSAAGVRGAQAASARGRTSGVPLLVGTCGPTGTYGSRPQPGEQRLDGRRIVPARRARVRDPRRQGPGLRLPAPALDAAGEMAVEQAWCQSGWQLLPVETGGEGRTEGRAVHTAILSEGRTGDEGRSRNAR